MTFLARRVSAARKFFGDPLHRGMSLLLVLHILTLALLVRWILDRVPELPKPDVTPNEAFILGVICGVAIMLPLFALWGLDRNRPCTEHHRAWTR